MKEKLKKTAIFASYMVPWMWVSGIVRSLLERYSPVYTNMLLYMCMLVALYILNWHMWFFLRPKEVKGWYVVICFVAALGIYALSLWVHWDLFYVPVVFE